MILTKYDLEFAVQLTEQFVTVGFSTVIHFLPDLI